MIKLIYNGDWGHSRYRAFSDLNGDYRKFSNNTTGVFCICFDEHDELVLYQDQPLGGHIEEGESAIDTLVREAKEEGNIELNKWKYFGYYEIQKVDTKKQIRPGREYPDKSYLLFFLARGKYLGKSKPLNSKSYTIKQIKELNYLDHPMIREGVKLHSLNKI